MGGPDQLEHHASLLRIRRKAARRDGLIAVVLLVLALVIPVLLSKQPSYEPGASISFIALLVLFCLTTVASVKCAEYHMLGNTLDLIDLLGRTDHQVTLADSPEPA